MVIFLGIIGVISIPLYMGVSLWTILGVSAVILMISVCLDENGDDPNDC